MDPLQDIADFKQYLRDASEHLRKAGVAPHEYRDNSGLRMSGWQYAQKEAERTEDLRLDTRPMYRGGSWGRTTWFLSVDGELYFERFSGEDELDRNDEIVTTLTYRIVKEPLRNVVGDGQPFEAVKRMINALVLRELAD